MPEALLTMWDIQHDNAIHLRTPDNRYIVFDLGAGSRELDATSSTLSNEIQQLDSIIISYPHVDDIDDAMMADSLHRKELFCPMHRDRQVIQHATNDFYKHKIDRYSGIYDGHNQSSNPYILPNYPDTWDGLYIQILSPIRTSENNINYYSHVIVIELEGLKILIPGDIGPLHWSELKLNNKFLAVTVNMDVLIVPHYGRDCGFDMDIMRHFNPRLTVISDGGCHDLSVIGRYSAISRGWVAYDSNDVPSERSCLTTGNDGTIRISFGRGEDDGQSFLYVRKSR